MYNPQVPCVVSKTIHVLVEISGSHGGEYKDESFLGYSVR
jgi:hypothetical protein